MDRATVIAAGEISGAASAPSENDPATKAEKASIARCPLCAGVRIMRRTNGLRRALAP